MNFYAIFPISFFAVLKHKTLSISRFVLSVPIRTWIKVIKNKYEEFLKILENILFLISGTIKDDSQKLNKSNVSKLHHRFITGKAYSNYITLHFADDKIEA